MNQELNTALREALLRRDFPEAERLLSAGADINARLTDWWMLDDVILEPDDEPGLPRRADIVRFMLKHGADPRLQGIEEGGPLWPACLNQDVELLRLLLENGADPNKEGDGPEPLYEMAEFDYLFEIWELGVPEPASAEDSASPDRYIDFLDRMAIKYGRARPDTLRLLRKFGAKSRSEMTGDC